MRDEQALAVIPGSVDTPLQLPACSSPQPLALGVPPVAPFPDESSAMDDTTRIEPAPGSNDGSVQILAAVSREINGLYRQQFGRGATSVRTEWSGRDALVTMLEDTLTPAERNLVKMGEHQRLRDTRMFFQYATVREFIEPIERITGRKVRAFLSAIDTEVDGLSIEMYVLHPAGYDGPSRIERAVP